ncbi:hypothetical protein TNCV_1524311 [Trichonephila clavipes]|nr:hypothetical protein TNCV_1524311 [Trichonephila clavipes]
MPIPLGYRGHLNKQKRDKEELSANPSVVKREKERENVRIQEERQCLQSTIFMKDGATPHIGRQVKALLSSNMGDNRDYPDICRMHGLLTHPT